MVEYETLNSEEIEFGEDEFIQIARKKSVSGEGETEFVSLARGFVSEDGDRRFKSNFSIPLDDDVLRFLSENLPSMGESD